MTFSNSCNICMLSFRLPLCKSSLKESSINSTIYIYIYVNEGINLHRKTIENTNVKCNKSFCFCSLFNNNKTTENHRLTPRNEFIYTIENNTIETDDDCQVINELKTTIRENVKVH